MLPGTNMALFRVQQRVNTLPSNINLERVCKRILIYILGLVRLDEEHTHYYLHVSVIVKAYANRVTLTKLSSPEKLFKTFASVLSQKIE